ncbi:hypothetical protein [Pseudomonas chlororaphis]|uniref:hypothetical protein n=1 Tax=Pseudomonas chlororaphis TaxID=587753 RepID=UPI000470073B|nr:hypothetical protein [Pseudomonas chlororaphis]
MNRSSDVIHLSSVTCEDVELLYKEKERHLHEKIDATRDAYFGFIFPINRSDLSAVSEAFELDYKVAQLIYKKSKNFSTFKVPGRKFGQLTNHIYGASVLALRGKSLDTGLESVSDRSINELVAVNEDVILEVAGVRASWFGRIFFPAQAFSNAISVFGGNVSPEALYALAKDYGYASAAGSRNTIRGDFGIALWLTLLARAP